MPAGAAPRNLPVARGRSTWPGMCEAWRRLGQHLSCPQPLPTSAASLGVTGQGAAQAMGAPQHCARPFPCSSLSPLFPFPSPSSSQGPRSATSTPAGATLPRGRCGAAGPSSSSAGAAPGGRWLLGSRKQRLLISPSPRGPPQGFLARTPPSGAAAPASARPLREFFFSLYFFFFSLSLFYFIFFSLSLLFPTLSSPVIPVILSARC